jgi:lysozyme
MNRPNITKEEALEYLRTATENITAAMDRYAELGRLSQADANRYVLTATQPHHDPVKVIAIRGYFKDSMGKKGTNDRGIYDDAIILMGPNYFKTFNGNTDNRLEAKGKAMLLPGWHLFKPGWHGYGKASGHAAFRTANDREVLPVLRDGQVGIKEGVTINFHSGGFTNTNSDGCQTVTKTDNQWLEFHRDAMKLLRLEGQKILPYLLLENL